jgi:hypothetical protein
VFSVYCSASPILTIKNCHFDRIELGFPPGTLYILRFHPFTINMSDMGVWYLGIPYTPKNAIQLGNRIINQWNCRIYNTYIYIIYKIQISLKLGFPEQIITSVHKVMNIKCILGLCDFYKSLQYCTGKIDGALCSQYVHMADLWNDLWQIYWMIITLWSQLVWSSFCDFHKSYGNVMAIVPIYRWLPRI